jgi:hypothetical protein
VWDREEQIEPLGALVNGILEQHAAAPDRHALASARSQPDAEEVARLLDALERQLHDGKPGLGALARLREQAADLADRAAWVAEERARNHLLERARKCLERLT